MLFPVQHVPRVIVSHDDAICVRAQLFQIIYKYHNEGMYIFLTDVQIDIEDTGVAPLDDLLDVQVRVVVPGRISRSLRHGRLCEHGKCCWVWASLHIRGLCGCAHQPILGHFKKLLRQQFTAGVCLRRAHQRLYHDTAVPDTGAEVFH
jgi:hypothetical protein